MLLSLFLVLLIVQLAFAQGSFLDSRDGKAYKTVNIGNQTWLAENLNYDTRGSVCYDKKTDNCQKCGRLYDWEMATAACPDGWRLPTDTEWIIFEDTSRGKSTDSLSMFPCGYRSADGGFDYYGSFARFWSATENGIKQAWLMDWDASKPQTLSRKKGNKISFFSVRCILN
jgi:hypothetical protein